MEENKTKVNVEKSRILVLNNILGEVKVGKLSKEGLYSLLDNKIELSKHVKEIQEAQKLATEELKPEALKQGAEETEELKAEWNKKYGEYIVKYLGESVEITLQKLTKDDFYNLAKENDLSVEKMEVASLIMA